MQKTPTANPIDAHAGETAAVVGAAPPVASPQSSAPGEFAASPTPAPARPHSDTSTGHSAPGSSGLSVLTNPGAGIDYERFLDCVHCGLCTASCPTYVETGNENDSPRGRIYLMRAVTDGRLQLNDDVRHHLDLCLDCRACETACPSGVQYGRLIEPFRTAMEKIEGGKRNDDWFHRYVLFGVFPYPNRLRWALLPAKIAQRTGLLRFMKAIGLMRLLPDRLRQLVYTLPERLPDDPPLPEFLPAEGRPRMRVALLTGCVADVMFRRTHWATARVLQRNGCDVLIPRAQNCCGAIHMHAGADEPARKLADANAATFADVDRVIVNVAGCGAMMKDYGHHWHDEGSPAREALAAKTRDINEFLDEIDADWGLVPPEGEMPFTATYHDACHLGHAQKVKDAPRRLLSKIPKLRLVELPETELCCGAAGTYNLTQPEMSARLSKRKMENILKTGAQAVLTANAGCLLQVAREARVQGRNLWIAHPIDLLDMSYRKEKPPVG
jgi:glycolate oxidase iron-sulfur subunit